MTSSGSSTHFDLLVIGFGEAGRTPAMQRAEAGDRVALVEQDPGMYGGTCINIGCVPTKTLLSATAREVDLQQAQGTRDQLVATMNQVNRSLADDAGVSVLTGRARFSGEREVTVGGGVGEGDDDDNVLTQTADTVVINTGAVPVWPDLPGIDSPRVHDSTSVQHVSPAPRRLVVVGGGPIGLEFATLFTGQSAQVTLLDSAPEPLKTFDPDVAAEARQVLEQRGAGFVSGARVTGFETRGETATVRYTDADGTGSEVEADAALVAIGRRPATDGLALEAAGVETGERGEVVVDEFLRTFADGVFAAGDGTGGPQFTYVSYDDHRVIAAQLSGAGGRSTAGRLIRTTTFVDPPLSTVGMSEHDARGSGRRLDVRSKKVADIPIMPRPKIVGRPEGYAKFLVYADSDEILGASLFCVDSQGLINTVALAMRHGITASELGGGIYTHPSSSEVFNALLG